MSVLLAGMAAYGPAGLGSNARARAESIAWRSQRRVAVSLLSLMVLASPVPAQETAEAQPAQRTPTERSAASIAGFLAGGALGLAAHEGGHLLFNVVFDANPELRKVDFHGVPFFAIAPRRELSPRRGFTISSAGFWVQHAGSEWILTRRPALRRERAPLAKGVLAFNVLASGAYAGAALARTGPVERDTRGMADSSRIDERWIGTLVLAPAILDAWRYFDPDAKWAAWLSRAVKIGMVLLVVR